MTDFQKIHILRFQDSLVEGGVMKKRDDAKFVSEKAKGYFNKGFN
jgi:hypothetical protein